MKIISVTAHSVALRVTVVLGLLCSTFFIPISRQKLTFREHHSIRILDRDGNLLRELLSPKQGYGQWVDLQQISPDFLNAIIAIEDHRFFQHHGVSLWSIFRALWQNLRAGQVVSGGSTLTQQLVRQIYPIRPDLPHKLLEIWLAIRLEHTLSKRAILSQYVNRVSFGNLNYGIQAASQFYFNRPAKHLSLAQAAFLAGLPQAPSRLNPLRNFEAAKKRQILVLKAMLQKGAIDQQAFRLALKTPLRLSPAKHKFRASHVVEWTARQLANLPEAQWPNTLRLSLNLHLQQAVQQLVRAELKGLRQAHARNAAVLVLDNHSGQIWVWLGSADYFNDAIQGQINGALALRQPGSTLKPFTYLLALENGFTPSTILPDIPLHSATPSGDYAPSNYDRKFHGPVTLRRALACSYNIPAVYLTQQLGAENLLAKLNLAGFSSLQKPPSFYGLGLTLGNGEVTLLELLRAYAGLAHGGRLPALRLSLSELPLLPMRLRHPVKFSTPGPAALITHILSDNTARIPAFGEASPLNLPFPCAAKTGTSKNYRDNWTVGYTEDYTVAVWVGNFDGTEMRRVSGISGAAPIFRDIMLLLHQKKYPANFALPTDIVSHEICPDSGLLPGDACPARKIEWFLQGTTPTKGCDWHQQLRDPRGGQMKIALVYPPSFQSWAKEQGIPQPLYLSDLHDRVPAARSLHQGTEKQLTLTFPRDGDIFKLDPILSRRFQRILFRARVGGHIQSITWRINGKDICTSAPPFTFFWQLQPGFYTLQAYASQNPRVRSQTVRFRVLP